MKSGPGNQRRMGAGPGGMPEPRTCTLRFLNPILIAVDSCRCGIKGSVSSGLLEPPYTEPYVRWCGRTAEVTPPPTRYAVPRLCAFLLYLKLHGMQCRIGAHSEVQIVGSGCQPGSLQIKDVTVSAKPEVVIG